VLYSADLRDIPARTVLSDTLARMGQEVPDHMAYAVEIVRGVESNADRIDELISSYAEGWTLGPDAGGRPQPGADRGVRDAAPRRHRRPGRHQRGVELAASSPPTTRRGSSTASSAASRTTP
jgi:hypothetical protein